MLQLPRSRFESGEAPNIVEPNSIFTIFAIQLGRITNRLYPLVSNPPHVMGPKRDDMQEQEKLAFKPNGR